MFLTLLLAAPLASAAQDVLVPEFTPGSAEDFGVSFLIYDAVVSELRGRGIDVIDAEGIRALAGDRGEDCIERAECPDLLFDDFPARLAVVGRVSQRPEGLDIRVELHDPNNALPGKVIEDLVPSGGEYDFTARIGELVEELLPLVQPRAGEPPPAEVIDEPPGLDELVDSAFEEIDPYTAEDPDPVIEEPDRRPEGALDDEERRALGVGDRAYAAYRQSGLPMDTWATDVRLRSFQLSFEILSGYGIGNVADAYDVRVAFDVRAGETLDTFQSRALGAGAGFQWGLGLGYHPRAWVETGLLFSFQRGSKALSVGWESYGGGTLVDSYSYTYEPAASWQGAIEPRARFFALTTGVFKPYAVTGLALRMLDGYAVPGSELVSYPDQEGGTVIDAVLGAGAMFDVSERASAYLEIPYGVDIRNFQGTQITSSRLSETPAINEGTRTLLRVSAGVQTRF